MGLAKNETLLDLFDRSKTLWEDNFNNGRAGWTQLISSAQPSGVFSLDSNITHDNSRWSLRLDTEDYAAGGFVSNWASAMAIKRLWRGDWMRTIHAEWVFAYGARWGGDGENAMAPRNLRFGLDTCDFEGNRRYFNLRYQISGEADATEGATRLERWQVMSAQVNKWATIPALDAGVKALHVNENKRNLFKVELEINVQTGQYIGVAINGDGFGSLAAVPDGSIAAIPGPALEHLDSFKGCLNPTFMVENRIYGPAANANATACWANLAYSKGVASA